MSDALDFLVKARPEAMTHYFSFLKDAGRHLDPKTRNLISVITKVHSQTERGLRQYLRRALREGCTAAEIIDALLMAFPALGLSRIVWATDVILAMNLPEFSLEALQGVPARWRDVSVFKDLPDGAVVRTSVDGRGLFLYRQKRKVQVYDSRCPHKSTDIPELAVSGTTLTCPRHEWTFDVPTGACIRKGNTPLTQLPSRIIKGQVQACW